MAAIEQIFIKTGLLQQLFINISKTEFCENLTNVFPTNISSQMNKSP